MLRQNMDMTMDVRRTFPVTRIVRVIDGDTIDFELDLGFDILVKRRIRVEGIDTPEARGGTEDDKKFASLATEWMKQRLERSPQVFISPSPDKNDPYGRTIARVFDNESSDIGIEMIENHHAVSYNGEVPREELKNMHTLNYTILRSKM